MILPGEVPLPKTLAEKKQYPRIFTGNVHLTKGEATIGLRRPKNSKLEVRVGCPLAVFGEVSINAKELTP